MLECSLVVELKLEQRSKCGSKQKSCRRLVGGKRDATSNLPHEEEKPGDKSRILVEKPDGSDFRISAAKQKTRQNNYISQDSDKDDLT